MEVEIKIIQVTGKTSTEVKYICLNTRLSLKEFSPPTGSVRHSTGTLPLAPAADSPRMQAAFPGIKLMIGKTRGQIRNPT